MKSKYKKIPLEVSIQIRCLYQQCGITRKVLCKKYPTYSKASVYRHAKKSIGTNSEFDKRKNNKGRPKKLTSRDNRALIRQIPKLRKDCGSFIVKRLRLAAGIQPNLHDETVRRFLHSKGYKFYHSRKKGLLSEKDLRTRLKYCREIKRSKGENFWRDEIAFFLDGAGFQHKRNPCDEAKSCKSMAWRRKDEGLEPGCTAKGSHVGSGGTVAHFMVGICYDRGVILCQQYFGRINGEKFSKFIIENFPSAFERSLHPENRLFLQDGDPSQNSKLAKEALKCVGATKFDIPPRSPDLNPIENVFNYVKQELHAQALQEKIEFETFEEFSKRIRSTLYKVPIQYINKTIDTMGSRIDMIIKAKGKRIKY